MSHQSVFYVLSEIWYMLTKVKDLIPWHVWLLHYIKMCCKNSYWSTNLHQDRKRAKCSYLSEIFWNQLSLGYFKTDWSCARTQQEFLKVSKVLEYGQMGLSGWGECEKQKVVLDCPAWCQFLERTGVKRLVSNGENCKEIVTALRLNQAFSWSEASKTSCFF